MKYFVVFLSLVIFFSFQNADSFADDSSVVVDLEKNAIKMIQDSEYEKSLEYLDKILEIDPDNQNALNNKGGVLIKIGNFSDAIDHFDTMLLINPNNTEVLNNKAIALSKIGNFTDSLTFFHKSLLTDSKNQNTINNTRNLVEKLYWIDDTKNSFGTISIRDKNDHLVGYSKISEVNIQPPLGYIYLKNHGTVFDYGIDGNTVEVIEFKDSMNLEKTQLVARVDLFMTIDDFKIKVVELVLNGLIGIVNEEVEYSLIIVDPKY